MEKIARVQNVGEDGVARVLVERETACDSGRKCSECAGCETMSTRTENFINAFNDANAGKGDLVVVRSESAPLLAAMAIVYIVPLVLAFVFYFAAASLFPTAWEGVPALSAVAGFALSLFITVFWDRRARRNQTFQYHIVEIKRACSGM